jgi:hypothetical protein
MPNNLIVRIAQDNDIKIPFDIVGEPYRVSDFLLKELNPDALEKVIVEYGDAGTPITYLFTCDEKTPPLDALWKKRSALLSFEPDSKTLESMPYFEEAYVNQPTQTCRIRFHYLKGRVFLYGRRNQIREERLAHYGRVVFRPDKALFEVRVKHGDVARKTAIRAAAALGFNRPPYPLGLRKREVIERFLSWIRSLNNARIGFSVRETISSLSMSARHGADLRSSEDFRKYLEYGMLKGGHATAFGQRIVDGRPRDVNLRIFFRDCRVCFTKFSYEDDIEYVVDALENIAEGRQIETPQRLLAEFSKQTT